MAIRRRLTAALLAACALAAPCGAQLRRAEITFKRGVPSRDLSSPCANKQNGSAVYTTWLGSDSSAVRQEDRTFCTPELARSWLHVWTRNAQVSAERAGSSGREVWAVVRSEPDGGLNDLNPTNDFVVYHYIRLRGASVLQLQGPDEEHVDAVLALLEP